MKQFRRIFALLMALVMLCSLAPVGITAHAADTLVSFTMEGIYDYNRANEAMEAINALRAEAGLPALIGNEALTKPAMLRAAEYFVYANNMTRPDGSEWITVGDKNLIYPELAICDHNDGIHKADPATFAERCCSVLQWNPECKSFYIGCFRQNDDSYAWAMLCSTETPDMGFDAAGSMPVEVTINALPSNLGGEILHHRFSNAFCANYLYEGTTVGTELQLRNRNGGNIITPKDINYGYTTSDDSVFTIDNAAHTITAKSVGKAELGITIDGQAIPTLSGDANVEVMEAPALTYEKAGNLIQINYGEFSSNLNLYIKGSADDMWTLANREADGIYDFAGAQDWETYTCVMRYFDDYLDDWVVVGEPLIINPKGDDTENENGDNNENGGNTENNGHPVFTPPLASDLPKYTSDPTAEQVAEALAGLMRKWPNGTAADKQFTYESQGGPIEIGLWTKGYISMLIAMSDVIFGDLPVKVETDYTTDDLRPGDIVCTNSIEWYMVTEVAEKYILTTNMDELYKSDSLLWGKMRSKSQVDGSIQYVLTRYQSAPTAPESSTIVPEDAEIIAQKTEDVYDPELDMYLSVFTWTLTADGTLYVEGRGGITYSRASWSSYQDQIKRVVIGPGITSIWQTTFSGYDALEEVVLGEDITEIQRSNFEDCPNLKHIEFSTGLKTIGENAFKYSGLESLILPEGLESIGDYAFTSCENIKTLYVPASVTEWGTNVFTSCNALEELVLEDGLTCLGYSAFNHLETLKTANIPGSLKTIPKMAFYFSGIETLNIADGVEIIDEEAFAYCNQLKEIHIPNTVTTVGDDAFRDCENVTDVYFYGTEAQFNAMTIGSSNDCLAGLWWSPVTIHFVGSDQCRHTNVSITPAIAPTCEQLGITEGKDCADCGALLTEQQPIPALGHKYERTEYTAPTCAEPGYAEYVCANDPGHNYGEEIAPTGKHSYTDGKCTVCGKEEPAVIENPFIDVADSAWYAAPVLWAKSSGVTGGKTETTFAPDEGCTRAQVVTFLWAANGKPEPKSAINPFTDVADNAWYLKSVLWAVEQGITTGTSATTFGPEQTCTRAQIATFLYAAAGKPPVTTKLRFDDVADTDWFVAPVYWAAENDVTSGIGNNCFGPNDTCTRAQVVTFLYKFYGNK